MDTASYTPIWAYDLFTKLISRTLLASIKLYVPIHSVTKNNLRIAHHMSGAVLGPEVTLKKTHWAIPQSHRESEHSSQTYLKWKMTGPLLAPVTQLWMGTLLFSCVGQMWWEAARKPAAVDIVLQQESADTRCSGSYQFLRRDSILRCRLFVAVGCGLKCYGGLGRP